MAMSVELLAVCVLPAVVFRETEPTWEPQPIWLPSEVPPAAVLSKSAKSMREDL